ncbi:MAG: aminotransferase class I/II-fold pyridoxal phosphate-dependent enzyme [Desulfurococcales archaeon]|nr:aminotransferase class I/II-fold pyridoxal phosphate-dependent enzyme [Desulfurococcales archaeon]
MARRRWRSRVIWGGWRPEDDPHYEPIVPPLYLSAIYRHPPGIEHEMPRVGDLKYSRENNPTLLMAEEAFRLAEEGKWALGFNSGMGALSTLMVSVASRASRIVVMRLVYAPTRMLAERIAKLSGVEVVFAGPPWEELIEEAAKSDVVIVESVANPTLRIPPLRELYSVCRESECKVIVDNTFASPAAYRPLPEGADIVVESATKYIAGHNDIVAGLAAGLREEDLLELWDLRRLLGTTMQPFEAYMTWRGLKTLAPRFESISKSARVIAEWLEDHKCVERVYYPGLPSHPDYEEARKLLPPGLYGGVVSFEVKGGQEEVLKVLENLSLIAPSPSFGGAESVIAYPEWSSHRNLPPEEKARLGIKPNLLRLSVGLEDVNDLIEDLDSALRKGARC